MRLTLTSLSRNWPGYVYIDCPVHVSTREIVSRKVYRIELVLL